MNDPFEWLAAFREEQPVRGKGPLCVVLHVTRLAHEEGLPLDPNGLRTAQEGQVRGLGGPRVQAILEQHGITKKLAAEGGRTSRGSLGLARAYALALNERNASTALVPADIEAWWVDRVREFLAASPFRLRVESGRTLRASIDDLIAQAKARQKDSMGATTLGTVLQHLVGAKLELALQMSLVHHGASVADAPSGRSGDFELGDTVIHVTTAPGGALLDKCRANTDVGKLPIIVTAGADVATAAAVAIEAAGLTDRVEVWDAVPFLVANLHEIARFERAYQRPALEALVERYNRIVAEHETDPSLQIELA